MARQVKKLDVQFFLSFLRESIFILCSSPYTFTLTTLTVVLPLSLAILVHNLVTQPPFLHLQLFSSSVSQLSLLLLHQFAYLLLLLFTFSVLSISVVFFTFTSSYTSKPITIMSVLSTIPMVFPCIFKTLLCVSIIMLLYYNPFSWPSSLSLCLSPPSLYSHLFVFTLVIVVVLFLMVYVYVSILSHFTSVVSVLESECGLATMKRSHELLHRMMEMASDYCVSLVVCVAIVEAFKEVVVKGPEEEGSSEIGSGPKLLIGWTIMWILVLVNLLDLLFQGMFYYVCRTHHREGIEKSVLYDHLDGYLGDNRLLESSVEIETV